MPTGGKKKAVAKKKPAKKKKDPNRGLRSNR